MLHVLVSSDLILSGPIPDGEGEHCGRGEDGDGGDVGGAADVAVFVVKVAN